MVFLFVQSLVISPDWQVFSNMRESDPQNTSAKFLRTPGCTSLGSSGCFKHDLLLWWQWLYSSSLCLEVKINSDELPHKRYMDCLKAVAKIQAQKIAHRKKTWSILSFIHPHLSNDSNNNNNSSSIYSKKENSSLIIIK